MDLGAFDFRTGKMLMSKMNKSRQRVRYDSSNQVKVSHPALLHPITMEGGGEWGSGEGEIHHCRHTVVGERELILKWSLLLVLKQLFAEGNLEATEKEKKE